MANRYRGYRRQPPVEGGRAWRSAGLAPEVEAWIEAEMNRWKVTGPFVISVALAEFAGIKLKDRERY